MFSLSDYQGLDTLIIGAPVLDDFAPVENN